LENYIPIVIEAVNEIHEVFGRYLLLLLFIKSRVFTERLVRLLCFERDIRRIDGARGALLSPVTGCIVCMCARTKVYIAGGVSASV